MLIDFEALHVEAWSPKLVFAADLLIQFSLLLAPVSWALKWSWSLNSFWVATFVHMPCVVEHLKFKLCPFNRDLNFGWILLSVFRTWTHIATRVLIKSEFCCYHREMHPSWHTDKVTLPCRQEGNYWSVIRQEVWWYRSTAPLSSLAKVSVIFKNWSKNLTNKAEDPMT